MSKTVLQIKKFDGKPDLNTAVFAFMISEAANDFEASFRAGFDGAKHGLFFYNVPE